MLRLGGFVAALSLFCPLALSQDGPPPGWVGPPPGWSGGVLAGVATVPAYEGSQDSRVQPVLGLEISQRGTGERSFAMGSRGLVWTFLQSTERSASLGLRVDPGRVDNGDRKLTPMGYRPGSDALRGMGNIDAAPLVSATGSHVVWGPLAVTGAVHHALLAHHGSLVDLGLALPVKLGAHATLSIAPAATWADGRYMAAFFGVTPAQSAASGYAGFAARGGLKSTQLSLDFDMALSRYWHLNATLQSKRLARDAAASPITQKPRQLTGLLGVLYQFQL